MTTHEFAEALGVSVENVYFHLRRGHIPHERAGRAYLIPVTVANDIISGYERNKTWPTTAEEHARDPDSRENGH